MTATLDSTSEILPEPGKVTLQDGTVLELSPLKARQFFKLLRIITRGAGMMLPRLASVTSPDDFAEQLFAMLILAVPEAEDEAIEFFRSMIIVPEDRLEEGQIKLLVEKLDNPELEDLVSIIESIVYRDAGTLWNLGKRLQNLFQLAQKTGQVPKEEKKASNVSKKKTTSEGGQEPSTS